MAFFLDYVKPWSQADFINLQSVIVYIFKNAEKFMKQILLQRDVPTRCDNCSLEVYIQIQSSHDFLLCEKCPYSELLSSVFSQICTEYKQIRRSLRIQSECGKIRTRTTPNTDTFNAVLLLMLFIEFINLSRLTAVWLTYIRGHPFMAYTWKWEAPKSRSKLRTDADA